MIEVYNYEGKNEEECRLNCLNQLDVYDNEILVQQYEQNNLIKMEVIKIEDVKIFINKFLNELFKRMNINVNLNIKEDEKVFTVEIKSNDNSIIIGKDGKNLESLQFILRQVLRNNTNFNIKINLDVSNYKLRKQKNFEQEIKKIINEVLKTKLDTKLDPMNSYNRRIVHNVANNYYNIETESLGEEPNRYVTIRYIEK